jgi:hypothetical protein
MELGRYGDEEMRKNRAESGAKLARTASAKGRLNGLGSWRGRPPMRVTSVSPTNCVPCHLHQIIEVLNSKGSYR